MLIEEQHLDHVKAIAERERAPLYVVGETTGDAHFSFVQGDGKKPFDLDVAQMFGHSPKTIMKDETVERHYENATYSQDQIDSYLDNVLQLEENSIWQIGKEGNEKVKRKEGEERRR